MPPTGSMTTVTALSACLVASDLMETSGEPRPWGKAVIWRIPGNDAADVLLQTAKEMTTRLQLTSHRTSMLHSLTEPSCHQKHENTIKQPQLKYYEQA